MTASMNPDPSERAQGDERVMAFPLLALFLFTGKATGALEEPLLMS